MFNIEIDTLVVLLTAIAFLGISLALVFVAVRSAIRSADTTSHRLAGAAGSLGMDDQIAAPGALEKLGGHLTLPEADEIKKIRYQLAEAGYYSVGAVKVWFALRLIVLIAPQILLIGFWTILSTALDPKIVVVVALALTVGSLFAPGVFLRWKKNKRILQAKNGFPDLMDLLVASVEAGLGLDAALMRVTDELGKRFPVLKVNLDLMNRELRAGQTRHSAMVTFADRINLEEAKALATIMRQSEEMGSSLGVALRVFSEEMRAKRMLLAEEKAMALSAKLTVPLIFFIFPAIMVMLMLPSGVRIAQGM